MNNLNSLCVSPGTTATGDMGRTQHGNPTVLILNPPALCVPVLDTVPYSLEEIHVYLLIFIQMKCKYNFMSHRMFISILILLTETDSAI